jgi:putative transposase
LQAITVRRKIHDDLMDMGESCCPNRVARLAQLAGIRAQIGYKRRPGKYGGKPSLAVDNTLDRQFNVEAPDKAWVTDITYIRTQEGFAYLAVVLDLFSRRIVGWSVQGRQTTNVVLHALLAAVWRRKPKNRVLAHSDQGSQFTSMEWASFLKGHNLEPSMSRRGNCHDNAVAESFFNLLKRERIRRKVYRTRAEARQDVFDYIEMFYNPTRKHARNGCCHPSSSNDSTKRKPRASRKLGAIQRSVQRVPRQMTVLPRSGVSRVRCWRGSQINVRRRRNEGTRWGIEKGSAWLR